MSDKEKEKEKKVAPAHDKINEPAKYADNAIVYSTKRQFLIDFNQSLPGTEKRINVARIILHPKTAGELLSALLTQVAKHEGEHKEGILPQGLELETITKKRDVH
jgi:hypothetical protein